MKRFSIVLLMLVLAGCQPTDEEIRADIATKARQDLNFAGLNYTVKNGMVDFTGNCPSLTALSKIKQKIENIHIIKSVNYNIGIAPVVLDTSTSVKLVVDSVLSKYPQVIARVTESSITLKGAISPNKHASLLSELKKNKSLTVNDSIRVQ